LPVYAAELAVNLETAIQELIAAGARNHGLLEATVRRQTRELPRQPPAPVFSRPRFGRLPS